MVDLKAAGTSTVTGCKPSDCVGVIFTVPGWAQIPMLSTSKKVMLEIRIIQRCINAMQDKFTFQTPAMVFYIPAAFDKLRQRNIKLTQRVITRGLSPSKPPILYPAFYFKPIPIPLYPLE
jgi:hypothetical protein